MNTSTIYRPSANNTRENNTRNSHPACQAKQKSWLQEEQDKRGQIKWEGNQKGKIDKRITESKARQEEALHCAQTLQTTLRKLLGNAENATRGGGKRRLTRRSRRHGTLAAHGAGEKHRGRMKHPGRGRSGLNAVCGGQAAQDVVRVSNMDDERHLSTPLGQQRTHMHAFRRSCMLAYLRQESRGVAA
jgi:hypothetical protein